MAVGPAGDVLVADQGNRSIRVLTAGPGTFYGVALSADDLGTVAGEGSYGPYLIDGLPAWARPPSSTFPPASRWTPGAISTSPTGPCTPSGCCRRPPMTLHGVTAQADDLYTVAGASRWAPGHRQTAWVQTRLRQPPVSPSSQTARWPTATAEADIVGRLPPGPGAQLRAT